MTSLILHIITHPDGGGAEKVVHLLSSNSCMTSKYQVFNIYLNNPRSHRLKSHEISLNLLAYSLLHQFSHFDAL